MPSNSVPGIIPACRFCAKGFNRVMAATGLSRIIIIIKMEEYFKS